MAVQVDGWRCGKNNMVSRTVKDLFKSLCIVLHWSTVVETVNWDCLLTIHHLQRDTSKQKIDVFDEWVYSPMSTGNKTPFCVNFYHKKCATGWFNLISLTIYIKALTPMASQRLPFLLVGHGAESHCTAVKPLTMWITQMAPNQRTVTALTEKRTGIR